jgi:hypothetical protein
MSNSIFGIKRLTENDVSWLEPGSKSHQAGINLPLRQFKVMFPEIVNCEGSPRLNLQINWHGRKGGLFANTKNDVVWYNSKRELRILHVTKEGFPPLARAGDLLVISRNQKFLEIYILPIGTEKVLKVMGLGELLP